MEVDVRVRTLEQPVLAPVGLADREHVAGRLEVGHVRRLVGRVWHLEHDVDDRLCREARDGRRSRVLEPDDPVAECGADARLLALVERRPRRVVLGYLDACGLSSARPTNAGHGEADLVRRDIVRIACDSPSLHDQLPDDVPARADDGHATQIEHRGTAPARAERAGVAVLGLEGEPRSVGRYGAEQTLGAALRHPARAAGA